MWGQCGESLCLCISIQNKGTLKVLLIIKKNVKRYGIESKATIYARLRDGRQVDMVASTNLSINPNLWDDKAEQVKSKNVCDDFLRSFYNDEVRKLKSHLEKSYRSNEGELTKDWLKITLDKYYNRKKYYTEQEPVENYKPTLNELFEEFLSKHKLSQVRANNYCAIKRGLQRYELYVRATKRGQKGFTLFVDDVTFDMLRDVWDFFENEYKYIEKYSTIYESIPEK